MTTAAPFSAHPSRDGSVRSVGLRVFFVLVATFGCGALAGAAVDRAMTTHRGDQPATAATTSNDKPLVAGKTFIGAGGKKLALIPSAYLKLSLTPEQQAGIKAIMSAQQHTSDSVLRLALPRLKTLTDETARQINALLTPEQRALALRFQLKHRDSTAALKTGPNGKRK